MVVWKFKCDCGNIVSKPLSDVKRGNTKSCDGAHLDQATNLGKSNTKALSDTLSRLIDQKELK